MYDAATINGIAPYAAVAVLLAGLCWLAVGRVAIKRANRPDGGAVFSAIGIAAYVTGAAFLLGFAAWLG